MGKAWTNLESRSINRATPIIRYDTGDLGIIVRGPKGIFLKTIEGRRWDAFYDTSGKKLFISPFTNAMKSFPELKQYQLVQEAKLDYTLNLRGARGVYKDEEFVKAMKDLLGKDARIKIVHLPGIAVLSSGKFRTTLSNYVPEDRLE